MDALLWIEAKNVKSIQEEWLYLLSITILLLYDYRIHFPLTKSGKLHLPQIPTVSMQLENCAVIFSMWHLGKF